MVLLLILFVTYFVIPSDTHMERTTVIDASPEKIFAQINSFERFNEWSPWAKIDPDTEYSYSGPESGVGARMSWKSEDPNVGNGAQEIIESVPSSKLTNKMEFEGMTGEASATFMLEEEGGSTKVTWTYDAKDVSGVFRFFLMGIDGMLGPQYESGLADLKSMVENTPDPEPEMEMEVEAEADSTSSE